MYSIYITHNVETYSMYPLYYIGKTSSKIL